MTGEKRNPCTCEPTCKTRTKLVDGLEFIEGTWCKAPQPWNDRGAWVKNDPVIESRVLAGLKAVVPDHEELVAEALSAERFTDKSCRTYWGSHGCDREMGHAGLCVCSIDNGGHTEYCEDECGDCDETPSVCSAGLKYGDGDRFILWWGQEGPALSLSHHDWTWFR